jgi:hypothetical protein
VDRQKQRAAIAGGPAQKRHHFERLPEIEAVERFIHQQQRMRRK